jgi:hypothetical protein
MSNYGGFTAAARMLGTSRQQVYIWWRRRHRNGFPEREEGRLFSLDEIAAWHQTYVPSTGGRPPRDILHSDTAA